MTKITTALTYEGIAGARIGPDRITELIAKAGNGSSVELNSDDRV